MPVISEITEIVSQFMPALDLTLVDFKEDTEASKYGGIYTKDSTVYFDPQFFASLPQRPAAFCIAHEIGESRFAIEIDDFTENLGVDLDDIMVASAKGEPTNISSLGDNYADAYAIRKAFESKWSPEELENCLKDCKSHLLMYFRAKGIDRKSAEVLELWLEITLRRAREIWESLQKHSQD